MAKSFARIHRSNLINSGIIPLVFKNFEDSKTIELGDRLVIKNAAAQIENEEITVLNASKNSGYSMKANLSPLEKKMILAGGKINMLKAE